jgi:hypothetical protein
LIETGEVANASVTLVARDAAVEFVPEQRVHQLGEDVAIVEDEPAPGTLQRVGKGSSWF